MWLGKYNLYEYTNSINTNYSNNFNLNCIQFMNYGLIIEQPQPQQDIFGGVSRSIDTRRDSHDWNDFLPVKEYQNRGTETLACVTFSALNCLEILFKYNFGETYNFSDRFTAKISGTSINGNGASIVADAIRKNGLVLEEDYPYVNGWDNYYSEIPNNLIEKGKKFIENLDITYSWAYNNIKEALYYSPLQVSVYAWTTPINGIYPDCKERRNHFVTLINYKEGEYWEIFDSYEKVIKRLAWDYQFGTVLKYSINIKKPKLMEIKNNTLIQLVEGGGGFGLYLNDKIYVDDLSKILASWLVRNNGNTDGMTMAMKLEDWNRFYKYNLKNEKL